MNRPPLVRASLVAFSILRGSSTPKKCCTWIVPELHAAGALVCQACLVLTYLARCVAGFLHGRFVLCRSTSLPITTPYRHSEHNRITATATRLNLVVLNWAGPVWQFSRIVIRFMEFYSVSVTFVRAQTGGTDRIRLPSSAAWDWPSVGQTST